MVMFMYGLCEYFLSPVLNWNMASSSKHALWQHDTLLVTSLTE